MSGLGDILEDALKCAQAPDPKYGHTFMIIGVDNLNRETVADKSVVNCIPNTIENVGKAEQFVEWLNSLGHCDDYGGTYYRIVNGDYRLSRGMEDLI
jgi:hypothetical protein